MQITAEHVGQSIKQERLAQAFAGMLNALPKAIAEQETIPDAIWLAGLLRYVGEQCLELELKALSHADQLNDLACARVSGRPS